MIKQNVQDAFSVSSRAHLGFSKPSSFPHPMFKLIHRRLDTVRLSQKSVPIAANVPIAAYLVH
jgi:hypothetical protein